MVKNLAKEQREHAHRFTHSSVSYTAQSMDLKELRNDPEIAPWLSEAPAQALQQALLDSNTAFKNFFANKAGYPKWAKRSGWGRFRDPQGVKVKRLSRCSGEVKIQGIGWVKIRMHRCAPRVSDLLGYVDRRARRQGLHLSVGGAPRSPANQAQGRRPQLCDRYRSRSQRGDRRRLRQCS